MKRALYNRWLKRLQDGSYRKTKEKLANKQGTAFCCLGVLACEMGAEWSVNDKGHLMPWIGKRKEMSTYLSRLHPAGLNRNVRMELAEINDNSDDFKLVVKRIKELRKQGLIKVEP